MAAYTTDHPENETGKDWFGFITAIIDDQSGLLVVALGALLAIFGGGALIYIASRN